MKFTITIEGAQRLGLDPAVADREFDGPSTREGLLGGTPRGILGWAKKALKVDRIEQLDAADARLLYYVLAIRGADHALLPITRFDDLALTDFALVPHLVTSFDQDGDCGSCNMPLDNKKVHIQPEDGDPAPDPTQAPAEPGTTETATTSSTPTG